VFAELTGFVKSFSYVIIPLECPVREGNEELRKGETQ
jgi:hypothetical protein